MPPAPFYLCHGVATALESPGRAPIAIVTVLFRPLVFEATNAQAMLSALESLFLIALTVARFRWIGSAFRRMRQMPYVGLAIGFVDRLTDGPALDAARQFSGELAESAEKHVLCALSGLGVPLIFD